MNNVKIKKSDFADWRLSDSHLGLRLGREREDVRKRARGIPVRAQLLEAARGHGRHQGPIV